MKVWLAYGHGAGKFFEGAAFAGMVLTRKVVRAMSARRILSLGSRLSALAQLLVATCIAIQPAPSRGDEKSLRRQDFVEIKSTADRTVRVLVVYPQVETPAHVVIIVHEDRGLTSWERRLADQLAEAGFIAIAPDLLSNVAAKGSGTDSFETVAAARAAIYDLKPEQVAADLDAVFDYARNLSGGDRRVAVAGFGWGGAQSFLYAAHNPDVLATAVFYGAAPSAEAMKRIKAPIFGFYAENDARISGEVSKVKGQMQAAGRDLQAVTYAGAGHGFFRTGETKDAGPADCKARSEAWSRLLDVLSGR